MNQEAIIVVQPRLTSMPLPATQGFRGFYKGYFTTVAPEIPFLFMQFPIWEFSKQYVSNRLGKR